MPGKVQVVQIAAGSNHTILRTADVPSFVPGFGRGSGTVATWIGASGDTTFIHSQARVYSSGIILDCQIVANNETVLLFPNEVGKDYMVIRRKCNTFYQYSLGAGGLYTNWCLEPKYDLLWAFNAAEMRIKSISACLPRSQEAKSSDANMEALAKEISFLRAPEFMIPMVGEISLPIRQLALNLLSTAYVATMLESRRPSEQKVDYFAHEAKAPNIGGASAGRGFSSGYHRIDRFEGYGGGWGYSAHSVEAIQFRTSQDIRLFGIGLFGGRGEYIAKLKLYRLCAPDYEEQSVELLSESDEMLYECAAHEKAQLLFPRPVSIKANLWHVICTQVNGPSSDCGASGQSNVVGEDGVRFFFRNSRMSNNGTDISVGQIPEFLYLSEASNTQSPDFDAKNKATDASHDCISCAISSQYLLTISSTTIESLFRLVDWSLQKAVVEVDSSREDAAWMRERFMIIVILALRFLKFYICSLYLPRRRSERLEKSEPSSAVAEQMVQFASIVSSIFEIANEQQLSDDSSARVILLEEAVHCVIQCSHVLYPSSAVFLDQLAFLMSTPNRDWSLVALLGALLNHEYVLLLFI
ncbi:unnamed protein product [Gongylonema pulchrum]|uniref:PHR domain-containing protein n=1 Tax=Gongylonema pulchrum TaxID=637853 RepID=A0A3P6PJM5_9BILA|nr:unnamed protein product [Gongylonema pulchrum]